MLTEPPKICPYCGATLAKQQDLVDHIVIHHQVSRPEQFQLYHGEQTLFKVRAALAAAGLSEAQISNSIWQLQNKGILFRERCEVSYSI